MNRMFKVCGATAILAVGMIISAGIISKWYVQIKRVSEKDIRVKGYAEEPVRSDLGTMTVTVRTQAPTAKPAYLALKEHIEQVRARLLKSGFSKEELTLGDYDKDIIYKKTKDDAYASNRDNRANGVDHVEMSQHIDITSKNLKLLDNVSRGIYDLMEQDIDVVTSGPNYYLSNLKDIKQSLLERATQDGYERARVLASGSGGRVGALRSARQGVIQITAPNCADVSDYGYYSTSTIDKIVKVVVTLEYEMD